MSKFEPIRARAGGRLPARSPAIRRAWLAWRVLACLLILLLAACASRPDLARLYQGLDDKPDQPPVIVMHGLGGSTLVDAETGKQVFPGSLGSLAFGTFRNLAQMSTEDREGEGLVPGELFASVAGVDFYGQLLHSLETVGRFHRGVPGQPVSSDGQGRRRYYVLVYDWRRDNVRTVRRLHELIEQIRLDYGDPNLRVDIVAHSNGGLIANYYLRYGPRDVLDEPGVPATWDEGDKRVRRLLMLGTPTLGSTTSLERLVHGMRVGLRMVPVEVLVTFATPFQALPHPLEKPVLDVRGQPLSLDIYDAQTWRAKHWGVFSPEVMERVRGSMDTPAEGERALADLHATFDRNLRRARAWQWALSAPVPPTEVEVAVFGGDCELTPGHAVEVQEAAGSRLAFRPGQVDLSLVPGEPRTRQIKRDFDRMMFEPGDGLVTRRSQVGRLGKAEAAEGRFHPLPVAQTFFLCESHGRLTHNAYFQNNLLYFLLAR